ncbi:MAG: hypothetical protein AABX73_03820 [Nanoarchaeota archaeon]
MKIKMLLASFFLLIGLIGIASACSCVIPEPPKESMESSTAVFKGEVVRIEGEKVNLVISKIYKGDLGTQVNITTPTDSAMCGFNFVKNKEYLVYTSGNLSDLSTNICTRTKLLSEADEDIEELDNLISKQKDCKNLYWFDNENKECGQKEFCGLYVYQGLQTFESKTQCEKSLNPAENKTFNLSNGRKAEIKIMPETASQKAIERLGELGFNVTLKEVGSGDKTKAVYELTGNKEGKFLGIFKIIAKVRAQVDAETGDVKVIKPWWSFLASGI